MIGQARSRLFSRFERRILLALLLTGLVPFVVWLTVGWRLLVEPALVWHKRAQAEFQTARLFYKEFIDAKKAQFSAEAETIANDPVLRDLVSGALDSSGAGVLFAERARERARSDLQARLQNIVAEYQTIRSIRIFQPDGELLVAAEGGPDRMGDAFAPKTWVRPVGPGLEAPRLEVEFLLRKDYAEKKEELQQFSEDYEVAIKDESAARREELIYFAAITAAVLVFAMGIGYSLARRVTKRINRVAAATEHVAQGRLDIQIPESGNDEITELTQAFNKMVAETASARDRIVYLEKVSGWQDLARRLAHEIKNPLTPIQLAIQELRRRVPEDGDPVFKRLVHDSVEVVEDEIGALTRLVNEFSQFARLPEVSPEPVELQAFIEEFLSAYNRFEPDAKVHPDLPAEPIAVSLDRVLMRRVLYNLAMNGIQAAGKGTAELWLSGRRLEDERWVEIRIRDNGPGVPAEARGRLFEPYFTTKAEGTGLGLAIVKKIVLQHRGSITLDATAGGTGASFVIRLPA